MNSCSTKDVGASFAERDEQARETIGHFHEINFLHEALVRVISTEAKCCNRPQPLNSSEN